MYACFRVFLIARNTLVQRTGFDAFVCEWEFCSSFFFFFFSVFSCKHAYALCVNKPLTHFSWTTGSAAHLLYSVWDARRVCLRSNEMSENRSVESKWTIADCCWPSECMPCTRSATTTPKNGLWRVECVGSRLVWSFGTNTKRYHINELLHSEEIRFTFLRWEFPCSFSTASLKRCSQWFSDKRKRAHIRKLIDVNFCVFKWMWIHVFHH